MTEVVELGPFKNPVSVSLIPGDTLSITAEKEFSRFKLEPVQFSVDVDSQIKNFPNALETLKQIIAERLAKELIENNHVHVVSSIRIPYSETTRLNLKLTIAKEIK
jgi:hypothetical protein